MKLYYYCSYTESPVGFILGELTYHEGQIGNYELSKEKIPPLIRKYLESGIIEKAGGMLPDETTYFLMVKDLTAQIGKGNAALKYYLNLALTTEDCAKFKNWLRKGTESEQELSDAIMSTLELDRESDFGYTVRSKELAALIQKSFQPFFQEIKIKPDDETVWFELVSEDIEKRRLKEVLPSASSFQMTRSGKRVSCKKKPTRSSVVIKIRNRVKQVKTRVKNLFRKVKNLVKKRPVLSLIIAIVVLIALIRILYGIAKVIK